MASIKQLWFWTALAFSVLSVASASTQSCTKVTFPNVLGFGHCISAPVDMCVCNTDTTTFVKNMIMCAVSGISQMKVSSQVYFLQGIMKQCLGSTGLGVVQDALNGFCQTTSVTGTTTSTGGSTTSGGGGGLLNIGLQIGVGRALLERALETVMEDGRGLVDGLLGTVGSLLGGGSTQPSGTTVTGSATSTSLVSTGQCSKPDMGSGIMCGPPAQVLFPKNLNLAQTPALKRFTSKAYGEYARRCQLTSIANCNGTSKNQVVAVEQLFQTVGCVYGQVLGTCSSNDKQSLLCVVLLVLQNMLHSSTLGIFSEPLNLLTSTIQQKCGSATL